MCFDTVYSSKYHDRRNSSKSNRKFESNNHWWIEKIKSDGQHIHHRFKKNHDKLYWLQQKCYDFEHSGKNKNYSKYVSYL
jgi:hypothetical protein